MCRRIWGKTCKVPCTSPILRKPSTKSTEVPGGARVTCLDSFQAAEGKGLSLRRYRAVACVHGKACCVYAQAPSCFCTSGETAHRLPATGRDGMRSVWSLEPSVFRLCTPLQSWTVALCHCPEPHPHSQFGMGLESQTPSSTESQRKARRERKFST